MEQGCCKCCVCFSLCQCIIEVLLRSCTAGRNYRNGYIFGNQSGQLHVVACLCSITVHTRKQDLSCAHLICLHRPLDCIKSGIDTSTVLEHIPAASIFSSSRINRNDHTLAAKLVCSITDQPWCIDSRGIDTDLIGALT